MASGSASPELDDKGRSRPVPPEFETHETLPRRTGHRRREARSSWPRARPRAHPPQKAGRRPRTPAAGKAAVPSSESIWRSRGCRLGADICSDWSVSSRLNIIQMAQKRTAAPPNTVIALYRWLARLLQLSHFRERLHLQRHPDRLHYRAELPNRLAETDIRWNRPAPSPRKPQVAPGASFLDFSSPDASISQRSETPATSAFCTIRVPEPSPAAWCHRKPLRL